MADVSGNSQGSTNMRSPDIVKSLLKKLDVELVIIELAAWAAYHGDRLPKADRDRTLLAIRRFEGLRGTINARIK
jgi:hypothetical protein